MLRNNSAVNYVKTKKKKENGNLEKIIYLEVGRGDGGGREWLSSKSLNLAASPSNEDATEPLGLEPL